ncbi:MAG: T9SS type A sorting domain-containing protein [Bacteroidota bacterium]|nr:T9SS type A sorting domain-containing protein [Bacteroidota bacterium]
MELDSTNNPEEIGAFVGDSCVGATTVLEDDSLVLVLGYLDGISGDLTFQEYNSNKASALQKNDYWVLNNNSGQWEKRKLSNKDRKGSYFISLRDDKKQSLKENKTNMGLVCLPNPVKENCRIQYYISKDANVQIMLYDIFGNLREVLYAGDTRAGQHEIQWDILDKNGKALPKGIYVVKMLSEGQRVQNKIIITN